MIKTSLAEFDQMSKQNPLVPVAAEILGDLDTPVTMFLKCTQGAFRFLLESVESATQRGRYSIIGDTPFIIFKSKGRHVTVENKVDNSRFTVESNPLDVLKSLLKKYAIEPRQDIPFYANGFFGYLGYDTVRYIEKLPDMAQDDINLPDIHMFIPQKIIVFDNVLHKINILLFVRPDGQVVESYEKTVNRIENIVKTLRESSQPEHADTSSSAEFDVNACLSQSEYEGMVMRAKQHIKRGDNFQIVLSQRLEVKTGIPAFQIYRALRVVNPSPYMFYMDMDGAQVLGASPETLVKLKDNTVYLKPIAGTRKRGRDAEQDQELVDDLLADPKERAEHTMLVDLGRNDVGRIARYGTVKVDEYMGIEKYSHVIHLVSTVTGKLARYMDAVDVFRACFPAGTLTGAPKVKAMEIIERLEPTRRSIYGGAVGYMTFNGEMDVCIAIRTIYIKGQTAYLQAGAGIVADSVPEKEYQECYNKANALLKAIEYAGGGLV
ncbi:MAG: anthranilate synthase component I [candidate division KSB1 bacterium]|nr:anthranilate synthase component I [candidate division KSB1 bacterium]